MRRMNVVNRKQALKAVKELDAFPKIPESYVETSPTGGGVSIIVFIVIAILVISEMKYYSAIQLKYEYEVDTEVDGKLDINIDMTVAMKCDLIGADVLDLTGSNVENFGHLKHEPAHYELSPNQQRYLEMVQNVNEYIRNEYHAMHELLWRSGILGSSQHMPPREIQPTTEPDACRVYGTLSVNKVAGNFHITAGKSVPVIPSGHAHLAMMVREKEYNFSHRIDMFSFGKPTRGIVYPLDGEEKIAWKNYDMFQYFIQVVPTKVRSSITKLDTFQFAVTERNRTIDHSQGSHGVPGIFVKYDMSSLRITINEEHKPYWQFLVRLCGIVGGVFSTSGMLHGLSGFLVDVVCCRFHIGKYSEKDHRANPTTHSVVGSEPTVQHTDPPSPGTNLLTQNTDLGPSLQPTAVQ